MKLLGQSQQSAKMIGLLYVTYGAFYLARKADSVVKSSLERELGFTMDDLGLNDGIYLLVYTFSLMLSGVLGSRLRSRTLIAGGLCGIATCSVLKTYAWSPSSFMVLQIFHAVFQSVGWPTCIRLLAVWIEGDRGLVMGVWTTCQSVGGILGAVFATYCTGQLSWRWAYYYHVPLLLAWAVVCFNFIIDGKPSSVKEPVEDLEAGTALGDAESATAPKASPPPKQEDVKLGAIVVLPGVAMVACAYFFLKFLRYALLMWLPYYYEDGLGFATSVAGYMSTSFEVGGMIGTPLIGWLSDRYFLGKRDLTSSLFMGGAAVMLAACRAVSSWGEFVNSVCMVFIGILVIGPDSVLSGTIAQDIGAKNGLTPQGIGSVAGFINSIGSAGSVLQSGATAYISRVYGWSVLFTIFIGCAAGSSVILCYVASRGAKRLPARRGLIKSPKKNKKPSRSA